MEYLRTPVAGDGKAVERATRLLVRTHTWGLASTMEILQNLQEYRDL